MAIKTNIEIVKLSALTGENWEESYIKVKPFTIREVQEYAAKNKGLEKLAKEDENKAIDLMINTIKDRFLDAKIWDEEKKELVDVSWDVIESDLLTVKMATGLIQVISGQGKA